MNRILKLQELDVYDDRSEAESTASSGSTSSCNGCSCEAMPIPV
jgi:hypothetical protein